MSLPKVNVVKINLVLRDFLALLKLMIDKVSLVNSIRCRFAGTKCTCDETTNTAKLSSQNNSLTSQSLDG